MYTIEKTLKDSIEFQGIGVHSGRKIYLRLEPVHKSCGIRFYRNNFLKKEFISAKWDHVNSTVFYTSITNFNNIEIRTIEHLMSALWACSIDNLNIFMDGQEVPIMDGSAINFIQAIKNVGVVEICKRKKIIKILNSIEIKEKDGRKASLFPSKSSIPCLEMSFIFNFSKFNVIKQEFWTGILTEEIFIREISSARTFCLLEDINKMHSMGLGLGGSLDNVIVVNKNKILNKSGLRFQNEFVRHKILDVVGDLYTSCFFIWGSFKGFHSGHSINNILLKTLFEYPNTWKFV